MAPRRNNLPLTIKRLALLIMLILFSGGAFLLKSQDLKKEVYVESTYRPEIADADKIGTMPSVTDTLSLNTRIDYTVLPSRLKSDYSLRPIKPAKMVGTPLDKLYNSYLKAGIGNYTSPVLEYSIQNLRSKEYAVGAYVFHKSSHYQQELVDSVDKVPAGYGKTEISAYGKRFYDNVNVMADVGADIHKIRYYGLNLDSLNNSSDIHIRDVKQSYNSLYAKTGVYSTTPDSSALNYSLFIRGDYLWDHFKKKEPHFGIEGTISHPVGTFRLALDGSYNHYTFKTETDSLNKNIITLHPFITKQSEEWQLQLGGRLSYLNKNGYSKTYFYPDAKFKFKVIDNAMMFYFGVTGYLENHTYGSIIQENPYIVPGLEVANTNHRYIVYTGFDGYLSSKAAYKFEITLDAGDSLHFFINDTTSRYNNQFIVGYDNADLIKYHGELNWEPLSCLGFYLRANFYSYKMTIESIDPWHKPSCDLTLTASYNFKQKIYADIDFFMLGKRSVPDYSSAAQDPLAITLNPVYDLNMKLEYKYSNVLGIFLHFYNLTNKQYYLWNQYPSQRLCVLGGINYKF